MAQDRKVAGQRGMEGGDGEERETEEEGERRFNNLRLWEVGGGRNALNDDNRREEAPNKGGRGLDRDIVLPGDQHICGKSA